MHEIPCKSLTVSDVIRLINDGCLTSY